MTHAEERDADGLVRLKIIIAPNVKMELDKVAGRFGFPREIFVDRAIRLYLVKHHDVRFEPDELSMQGPPIERDRTTKKSPDEDGRSWYLDGEPSDGELLRALEEGREHLDEGRKRMTDEKHEKTVDTTGDAGARAAIPATGGMRVIARRTDEVWLVTDSPTDPPPTVRVLDLSMGRLYPPYPREGVLAAGEWEMLSPEEAPDATKLLRGVEVMPTVQEMPPVFVSAGG